MTNRFTATLVRPVGTGTWTYLNIPEDAAQAFGAKGQIKVRGAVDGEPFQSTLMPDGEGGHFLVVNKTLRDKIGKAAGDMVEVELEPDEEPRKLAIPDDFQAALSINEQASANFDALAHSLRKRYVDHIEEAKTLETRMSRIDKAVRMLAEGKKP